MALLTNFLKLFKWNTEDESDLEQEFDIDTSMNDNWDKLDEAIEDLDTNKVDKVDGKGLSTNDFTNEDKSKLDSLENYDDAKIKQDIEKIQAKNTEQDKSIEQNTATNTKQDELIQKLKDNSINITTEEATSLHITDASTLPAKLDVRGNQRQATREGYNLLKINSYNVTFSGITFKSDLEKGYISATGTSTGASGMVAEIILPAGTYTFSGGPANGSSSKQRVSIYDYTNEQTSLLVSIYGDTSYTITINEEKTFRLNYVIPSEITVNDERIYLQVVSGTEEKPFEVYGASPSLDYPSEVEAVGDNGSVEIKKINKNFFDKDTVQFYNNNSSAFENTDNNVPTRLRTSSFEIKEGSYVLSGLSSTINLIAVRAYNENKEYMSDGSERTGNNFTLKQGVEYIHLLFSKSDNSNISKEEVSQLDIQIEKGNIASDYAKHEEQSYVLDIQKPMLSGDYFVKEADGWKEVHNWKKVVFTGNETFYQTMDSTFYRYSILMNDSLIKSERNIVYSNYYTSDNLTVAKENLSYIYDGYIYLYSTMSTLEQFKQLLNQKNTEGSPAYVYYKLATPTKLPCTEAQSNVLDQLNELELFKGTNNIITAESLALLQMSYIADTQSYIDNRIDEKLTNINQQILNIVGGN